MKKNENRIKIYRYHNFSKKEYIIIAIEIVFLLLVGIISIYKFDMNSIEDKFELCFLYSFSLLFYFSTGFFIGISPKLKSFWFFIVNCTLGMSFMIGPTFSKFLNSPIMNDNPQNIIVYLIIATIILIISVVLAIVYHNNSSFRKKKYIEIILFFIISIPIIMVMLLPLIMDKLLLL